MDINEIAKDTYYFSINNKLSGFITERNAIKCFERKRQVICWIENHIKKIDNYIEN